MAANTAPCFPLSPNIGAAIIGGTANVKSDGAGTIATDIYKIITGGTNGTWIKSVRLSPFASVAATATAATVLRLFISTKTSGATTSADTFLWQETAAAAQTADQTTTSTFYFEVPFGLWLPANYTILGSSHIINATNTGWIAIAIGEDF